MTNTLPKRAADLKARLMRVADLSSEIQKAYDLESLRQDLARRVDKLDPQIGKDAVLRVNGIALTRPASVQRSAKRASGLLEKFRAEPTVVTLKKGQVWRSLLEEVDTAASDLGQALQTAWRGARKSIFAGATPTALEGQLARTAENDAALAKYRALHLDLDAVFQTVPSDQATIDEAKRLAGELARVTFNFDVPEAVKIFLAAVQSVGGAPLALLTDEVIGWLKENHSYDAYRISAKARA
jgi:hypothetical protein